jgi:regulator of CtrA degradation
MMTFIELRINRANELLKETHNYLKWQAPLDIKYMSQEDIFKVCHEAMRVTTRISRIIGWLMLQKAILEGEVSLEDVFYEKTRILRGPSCLEASSENDFQIPYRLRELLKKSRSLYIQTMKLEEVSLKNPPPPAEIKKRGAKGCYLVPHTRLKKE